MWEVNSFGGMSEEVCEPLSQSLGGLNCRANKTVEDHPIRVRLRNSI